MAQQEIVFKKGITFVIEAKNKYEKLPISEGLYEIVFDHYFDGEKCHNNSYLRSDYMTVMIYSSKYSVGHDLKEMKTSLLHELLDDGYLKLQELFSN